MPPALEHEAPTHQRLASTGLALSAARLWCAVTAQSGAGRARVLGLLGFSGLQGHPLDTSPQIRPVRPVRLVRPSQLDQLLCPQSSPMPRPPPTRRNPLRRGTRRADQSRETSRAGGLADVAALGAHLHLRRQMRQARHHAEIHRPPAPRRNRHLHAGHRPRAAADRRAGHGQVLALRASRRRHQRRLHQGRPGHRRHDRGTDPLHLELRHAHRARPEQRVADQEPHLPRDGIRQHRALRGNHPLRLGGAGRADLAALGKAAVGAGTRDRGPGATRLLRHRHGQHARPRRQRHVGRPEAPLQHRRAARAGGPGDGSLHRHQARRRTGRPTSS